MSVVQTTSNLREHLKALPSLEFGTTAPASGTPILAVNDAVRYQQINGFGAAMTDSSAWLIEKSLPPAAGAGLLSTLFSPSSLHLDFVRVPIAASDFTATGAPYSYDDPPPGKTDPNLVHFSIAHDEAYILPALRQVGALNPQTEFLATPWTPPAWMKSNDSLGNVGDRGTLLKSAYGPWAAYIVKFLQAYAAAGVPISALTPQNEPQVATSYPGLNLPEPTEADLITQDLIPALTRAHLAVKIYGGELGWSSASMPYFEGLVGSPAVHGLAGLSWHCYYGSPDAMSTLHYRDPALDEIVDECSPGISAIPVSDVVISSLRNWASTVALWNLALNTEGGPVQQPNTGCSGCYGLAIVNQQTHSIRLTNAFFQLGQASEFIQPGAVRVASTNFVTYDYTKPGVDFISPGLDDVAVLNPDGSRVVLVHDTAKYAITFAVEWDKLYFEYSVPAGATVTFEWDRPAAS